MSYPYESLYYIYDAGHRWGPPDMTWPIPGIKPYPLRRRRPTEVPVVTAEQLIGKFGMSEKEQAALIIMRKAHAVGTYDIVVTIDDFQHDGEITGFLQLLCAGPLYSPGYFEPARVNPSAHREFKPTADFYDRIVGEPLA